MSPSFSYYDKEAESADFETEIISPPATSAFEPIELFDQSDEESTQTIVSDDSLVHETIEPSEVAVEPTVDTSDMNEDATDQCQISSPSADLDFRPSIDFTESADKEEFMYTMEDDFNNKAEELTAATTVDIGIEEVIIETEKNDTENQITPAEKDISEFNFEEKCDTERAEVASENEDDITLLNKNREILFEPQEVFTGTEDNVTNAETHVIKKLDFATENDELLTDNTEKDDSVNKINEIIPYVEEGAAESKEFFDEESTDKEEVYDVKIEEKVTEINEYTTETEGFPTEIEGVSSESLAMFPETEGVVPENEDNYTGDKDVEEIEVAVSGTVGEVTETVEVALESKEIISGAGEFVSEKETIVNEIEEVVNENREITDDLVFANERQVADSEEGIPEKAEVAHEQVESFIDTEVINIEAFSSQANDELIDNKESISEIEKIVNETEEVEGKMEELLSKTEEVELYEHYLETVESNTLSPELDEEAKNIVSNGVSSEANEMIGETEQIEKEGFSKYEEFTLQTKEVVTKSDELSLEAKESAPEINEVNTEDDCIDIGEFDHKSTEFTTEQVNETDAFIAEQEVAEFVPDAEGKVSEKEFNAENYEINTEKIIEIGEIVTKSEEMSSETIEVKPKNTENIIAEKEVVDRVDEVETEFNAENDEKNTEKIIEIGGIVTKSEEISSETIEVEPQNTENIIAEKEVVDRVDELVTDTEEYEKIVTITGESINDVEERVTATEVIEIKIVTETSKEEEFAEEIDTETVEEEEAKAFVNDILHKSTHDLLDLIDVSTRATDSLLSDDKTVYRPQQIENEENVLNISTEASANLLPPDEHHVELSNDTSISNTAGESHNANNKPTVDPSEAAPLVNGDSRTPENQNLSVTSPPLEAPPAGILAPGIDAKVSELIDLVEDEKRREYEAKRRRVKVKRNVLLQFAHRNEMFFNKI